MVVRSDITIDFTVSPRIATIAAPSTTITIQDLHDTLRNIEARVYNTVYSKLLDSTGKDDLGGGNKVGITLKLLNSKLAFEARSGPSYIQCTISGGNLIAVDANNIIVNPIQTTAFTQVVMQQSTSPSIVAEWTQTEKDNVTNKINTMTPQMSTVYKIQYGKWKVINNQLIMYDPADGTTVVQHFNLFDKDGNPAEVNVMERRPV